MTRYELFCFLACFLQKSLCQVITNTPYYANTISTNGVGISSNGIPVMNSLVGTSSIDDVIGNGMVPNNIAITSGLPSGPIYSGITGDGPINAAAVTTMAANAVNTMINGGGSGLEGFSLGGLPYSGVSPMGYGDVAVAGQLPVGGSTAVVGNVPVIGYVTFEGTIPAGGTVSLASNCGCSNPTI
ncbi:unnamed protein product [Parnassius mnemosyne]|uniref:Uncharacterized protein n=1 Tax=Parnassius mnemosyne TaxID=213953 RepID=A0AAV1LCS0_9NEOP